MRVRNMVALAVTAALLAGACHRSGSASSSAPANLDVVNRSGHDLKNTVVICAEEHQALAPESDATLRAGTTASVHCDKIDRQGFELPIGLEFDASGKHVVSDQTYVISNGHVTATVASDLTVQVLPK